MERSFNPMAYKLLVVDMDGTLLDDDKNISSENIAAVREMQQSGVPLVLATGRSDAMVKRYLDLLQIEAPVISCNGAFIRDRLTGEILHEQYISSDDCEYIIDVCREFNSDFHIYGESTLFGEAVTHKVKYYVDQNKRVPHSQQVNIEIVPDCKDVLDGREDILKVLIPCDDDIADAMADRLNEIPELVAYKSTPKLLDVMRVGVDKGNAMLKLAAIMGIDPSEIVAIGDNHNDYGLIKEAGFGVAVANAEPEVKQVADLVTISNNDPAVADIIRRYIL